MIEQLNALITSHRVAMREQDAKPTSRINKDLIENYRDYIAFHEIDHKALSEKQLKQTSKFCKTIKL